LALNGGEWLASCPSHFTPRVTTPPPPTPLIWGLLGAPGLNKIKKKKKYQKKIK